MPRKEATRPSPAPARSRANDRVRTVTVAPYARDERWATPLSRRRTDIYVVDVADRYSPSSTSAEDPLALTA